MRKIWKKSSSGGPWLPIVFNPLYWGTPIGCLHCSILWGVPWADWVLRLIWGWFILIQNSQTSWYIANSIESTKVHNCHQIRLNSLQASSQSCIWLTEERIFLSQVNLNLMNCWCWWFWSLLVCILFNRRSTLLISPKIRSWWPPAERWHGWHLPVQCDHRVTQISQRVWCIYV